MLELMFTLLSFLSAATFDYVQKPPGKPIPLPLPKAE
jgi:hypothetical protein